MEMFTRKKKFALDWPFRAHAMNVFAELLAQVVRARIQTRLAVLSKHAVSTGLQ